MRLPILLLCICVAGRAAAEGNVPELSIWRDPDFQKKFMGSYGFRAEVEPTVTEVEKELMDRVLTLMQDPRGGQQRATRLLAQSITPGHSAVFDFTLGSFYLQDGKLEGAVKWYKRALGKFDTFLRAHETLGQVYVKMGEHEKAVAPLTRAIELGAGDGTTYGLLGFAYLMTERYASAESAYRQAMLLQSDILDWKLGLARALFKQRNFGRAAALCAEMLDKDPGNTDLWLLQANAYLGMEKPMEAAANYEYVALLGKATVASLNVLGDIYVNEGLLDLALDAYLRALAQADGDDATRWLRNAEVLTARGAYREATAFVTNVKTQFAGKMAPDAQKRMLKLEARLAAASNKATDEQALILERIVSLDPLDGEALILLGRLYAEDNRIEKAAFYFERAAGIDGYTAKACLRHAQALVRAGRFDDAIPLLKRAQEVDPRDDVGEYLQQVQRVARMKN